jgi:fermentation-respiration switch protein FrsA (DUF1100 family)
MLKLVMFLVAGYGAFVLLIFATQNRLLFLPNLPGRELAYSPADIGLAFDDVQLTTADGVRLHGWYVPGPGERVVLFFHGNAGNISHRLGSIQQFHDLGLSVLIVDYRGYGQSEGRTTERGTYQDAEAAWRYLTAERNVLPQHIVVFGRSLGGPVAAWLASRQQPGGLIVESAFSSIVDIGRELYPFLPVRWLTRFRYPTREYLSEANCPVLVVHSREDEIIPFHHGERNFAAAQAPRHFLEIHGGHNEAHVGRSGAYVEGLRSFLAELSSGVQQRR